MCVSARSVVCFLLTTHTYVMLRRIISNRSNNLQIKSIRPVLALKMIHKCSWMTSSVCDESDCRPIKRLLFFSVQHFEGTSDSTAHLVASGVFRLGFMINVSYSEAGVECEVQPRHPLIHLTLLENIPKWK